MKKIHALVSIGVLLLAGTAFAQNNVYSLNIVGYVNVSFKPGANLFANPLDSATGNSLSSIFTSGSSTTPDGSSIWLWNSTSRSFSQSSVYQAGAWSVDLTLNPGQGAMLMTGTSFINTFVGSVLAPDGSPAHSDGFPPPSAFSGPNSIYLLSCATPLTLTGTDTFLYVLGRTPNEGEQFMSFDATAQTLNVTTYLGGAWDNGTPTLHPGESAFYNVGPVPGVVTVPEPSCVAFCFLIAGTLLFSSRRNQPVATNK
jgi:hypothetical protein